MLESQPEARDQEADATDKQAATATSKDQAAEPAVVHLLHSLPSKPVEMLQNGFPITNPVVENVRDVLRRRNY
jgi:hypothetical protein